jgi:hypothetical protein
MGLFERWKRGDRKQPSDAVEDAPPPEPVRESESVREPEPESEPERTEDAPVDASAAASLDASVEPSDAEPEPQPPRRPPTAEEIEDFRQLVDPGPPMRGRGEPRSREEAMRRGISGWVEERAHRVVRRAYESHAGDLEERARRVIGAMYEHTADDLEERAVRAMRRALEAEAQRIKDAIEHAIEVKKREVRLSLIVLVVSALVYLLLYWFTAGPPSAS